MVRMGKIYKTFVVFATAVGFFVNFSEVQAECYTKWYIKRTDLFNGCIYCDFDSYDYNWKDSCSGTQHPRQYGIKLCSTHRDKTAKGALYYQRGYTDYNCLAYVFGKTGVQSWVWPTVWDEKGPTVDEFKIYIQKMGYKCTMQQSNATGKKVFYVYAKNGRVKHFARKYKLDGSAIPGVATISKWGAASLYTTTTTDPYEATSGYGSLVLICYK